MTVNFSLLALDQIVNNAATLRHMSRGQFSVMKLSVSSIVTWQRERSRSQDWARKHRVAQVRLATVASGGLISARRRSVRRDLSKRPTVAFDVLVPETTKQRSGDPEISRIALATGLQQSQRNRTLERFHQPCSGSL